MLDYNILKYKPSIEINNEYGIDLLHKTLKFEDDGTYRGQFLSVNEYYIARPDLISLAIYGDDKYGDVICKLNGISNPFELNKNTILFIPSFEYIDFIIDRNIYNKTTKITQDTNSIASSNKKGDQKLKTEQRTSNQQLVGDTNYIIDKSLGVVFY